MFEIDLSVLVVVLALIMGDVVSGLIKAFATETFNSSAMRKGMWHKAGSLLLLMLAAGITIACQYVDIFPEEFGVVYLPICGYVALMELGSILENILQINPDLDRYKIFQIFGKSDEDNQNEEEE